MIQSVETQLSYSYRRQDDMEGQDAVTLMNTFSDRKVLRPEVVIMVIYSELL